MPPPELLAILLVVAVCGALLAGYPVALTLGGVSLAFAILADVSGLFPIGLLYALPSRVFGMIANAALLAIPLFIFMGVTLERSRIAEDLLEPMARLFGTLAGRARHFARARRPVAGRGEGRPRRHAVTIGLIALPAMLRHGYDHGSPRARSRPPRPWRKSCRRQPCWCCSATSSPIRFRPRNSPKAFLRLSPVSVTDLFAGAIVPGLALVGLYLAYLVAVAIVRPATVPPIPADPAERTACRSRRALKAMIAPLALIFVVLGSILVGLATPTEAAAVGAVGSLLLAVLRVESAQWPFTLSLARICRRWSGAPRRCRA